MSKGTLSMREHQYAMVQILKVLQSLIRTEGDALRCIGWIYKNWQEDFSNVE